MKPSPVKWLENVFPLVDLRLSRGDCQRVVVDAGLPTPQKSSCVFCPYHDDAHWLKMRRDDFCSWSSAVAFDASLRGANVPAKMREKAYLHRTLKPLDEVEFKHEKQETLWDSFSAECEGMCGV